MLSTIAIAPATRSHDVTMRRTDLLAALALNTSPAAASLRARLIAARLGYAAAGPSGLPSETPFPAHAAVRAGLART